MLCPNCTRYTWQSTAGSCESCSAATPNYYTKLCSACSVKHDECEICRTNMGTKKACPPSAPSGWVITKATKDDGTTVKLNVGDELQITLDETRMKEWYAGYQHDTSYISESQRCDFLQSQSNYNQGTRTIKFKAKASGTTTLVLDEWQMRYDYSGWGGSTLQKDKKTGTTWKITITVK